MTQTSWPFENADTTEAQFSQLFRRLQTSGVSGAPSTTDLKVTGDSTGMQVKVAAGYAIVRGHAYYNSAEVTLAIGAASTNPRIDLVVLRLNPTANSITLVVVPGTAAVTPVAPTLTQSDEANYDLPIGSVLVGASVTTIAPAAVTDVRPFLGTQFGRWTTATRPASPVIGTAGFNTTLSIPEVWNGTAWAGFTPVNIFVQSATPTALAVGDLWFY